MSDLNESLRKLNEATRNLEKGSKSFQEQIAALQSKLDMTPEEFTVAVSLKTAENEGAARTEVGGEIVIDGQSFNVTKKIRDLADWVEISEE